VVGQLITTKGPVELITPVVYPVAGTISLVGAVVDPQVSLVAIDELSTEQEPIDASTTSTAAGSSSSTSSSSSTTTTIGR
jgi:hypothetical protein